MLALRAERAALLWLTLAVAVSYANALTGQFQFDDYNVIVNEPQVHSWSAWLAGLGSGIRPLLKLSYVLNWTMGAGAPGFHLTNLLIHLANAYFVYRLGSLFVQQQWRGDRLRHAPLLAALLFALHPIHTEAVTYISGRSASLMTLFYLAGLLCYIQGRTSNDRMRLYVFTPLLFILAMGVKETAVTFPLALLIWELLCGGRWSTRLAPMWPNWAWLGVATMFFLFSNHYSAEMQRSADFNSLQGNLATQMSALTYLLKQWVFPLHLNIDPDLPLMHDFSGGLLPIGLCFVLGISMVLCWRRRPWGSFALAWLMVHLIPLYLFLPRLDIANERQMYLAGWPLFLALSIELALWLNGRALRFAAAALLIALASLTVMRNQVYANEISLWEDTALKSPSKARVHNNLGHAYLLAQRTDEARSEFVTALRLDPQLYQARNNLYRTDDEKETAKDHSNPGPAE